MCEFFINYVLTWSVTCTFANKTNIKGSCMLTARNIHKKYGSLEVLKGVDLDINKGEIVSIVGSSGAGKSA